MKVKDRTVSKDKRAAMLSDEALERVAGGFSETGGPAAGNVIICPNCKEEAQPNLIMSYMRGDDVAQYDCQTCHQVFYVDGFGEHFYLVNDVLVSQGKFGR